MINKFYDWKEFKIADIFEVLGSKTTIKKNINFITDGKYPYITTKGSNNGIDGFSNNFTDLGNILTVDSAVLGNIFYQDKNFLASDHVEKLVPKFKLNKYIAIFIITAIKNKNNNKFDYNLKYNQKRIKKTIIKLPINKYNDIDFLGMENYIKNLYKDINLKIENIYKNFKKEYKYNLDNFYNWKEFKIEDIFEVLSSKKYHKKDIDKNDKEINYVTRTGFNNGILCKIKNKNYNTFKNVITVAGEGAHSFFQNEWFITGNNITILNNKNLNLYNATFIITMLNLKKDNYSYTYPRNRKNLINELIKLPINKENKIDFLGMENYIKERWI